MACRYPALLAGLAVRLCGGRRRGEAGVGAGTVTVTGARGPGRCSSRGVAGLHGNHCCGDRCHHPAHDARSDEHGQNRRPRSSAGGPGGTGEYPGIVGGGGGGGTVPMV